MAGECTTKDVAMDLFLPPRQEGLLGLSFEPCHQHSEEVDVRQTCIQNSSKRHVKVKLCLA